VRVGVLTGVRLLVEAISVALSRRNPVITVVEARSISQLEALAMASDGLSLAIIDAIQPLELSAVRALHRDHPGLPLMALGVCERGSEIVSCGSAGFTSYLRREDGLENLCTAVADALEGRLYCPPEISAAMMRALSRRGPLSESGASTQLTRREHEVAQLVGRALSNKEIARELRVSESTVKHHVHAVLGKFGVARRSQVMRTMRDDHFVDEPPLRSVVGA
jgi:two-component system nitrate/nitrite response regulator NarL